MVPPLAGGKRPPCVRRGESNRRPYGRQTNGAMGSTSPHTPGHAPRRPGSGAQIRNPKHAAGNKSEGPTRGSRGGFGLPDDGIISQRRVRHELMTPFQRLWADRASRLGLSATIPFTLSLDGETLSVPVLLRQFGAPNGMLLVTDFALIRPHANRLVELGYGYSCLSESTQLREEGDNDLLDMLRDWGRRGSSAGLVARRRGITGRWSRGRGRCGGGWSNGVPTGARRRTRVARGEEGSTWNRHGVDLHPTKSWMALDWFCTGRRTRNIGGG